MILRQLSTVAGMVVSRISPPSVGLLLLVHLFHSIVRNHISVSDGRLAIGFMSGGSMSGAVTSWFGAVSFVCEDTD